MKEKVLSFEWKGALRELSVICARVSPHANRRVCGGPSCARACADYLFRLNRLPAFFSRRNLARLPRSGVALAMFIFPRT